MKQWSENASFSRYLHFKNAKWRHIFRRIIRKSNDFICFRRQCSGWLPYAHLTSTFDALNMWKMRYQKTWVCLRSSQFLYLEIQAFLDHSSIANVYRHLILNRMIYNLHKFLENFSFCKKVWHHQSRDFQGCLPQILALEQRKKHLHQVSSPF